MDKRNLTFDIARSLCVIWIVGFWHIGDYIDYTRSDIEMAVGSLITMGVLGCFSFMSGYFLKKYQFEAMDDVIVFAKKKIIKVLCASVPFLFFALFRRACNRTKLLYYYTVLKHNYRFGLFCKSCPCNIVVL